MVSPFFVQVRLHQVEGGEAGIGNVLLRRTCVHLSSAGEAFVRIERAETDIPAIILLRSWTRPEAGVRRPFT